MKRSENGRIDGVRRRFGRCRLHLFPDAIGFPDEQPETTAGLVREWAEAGQVNALGGCCGNTPAHIAAMAEAVQGLAPRKVPTLSPMTRLAGLEPFTMAA